MKGKGDNMNKEFAVFGLGKFGVSVAKSLMTLGCQVIVVDRNEERVQEIADDVTYAMVADVTDSQVLENLGIRNLDGVVIAISNYMEASVMATILAKEMGVPMVLAKASNEIHKKILLKVGVDTVVFPEKEMGIRIARNLVSGNFVDFVEVSHDFSIVEVYAKEEWQGKTIRELNFRGIYGVNIIAVKYKEDISVSPNPDVPLKSGCELIMIGRNSDLKKLGIYI